MELKLTENDQVVLSWLAPKEAGFATVNVVLEYDMDSYHVTTQETKDGTHNQHWRGDFKSCLNWMVDWIIDLERDFRYAKTAPEEVRRFVSWEDASIDLHTELEDCTFGDMHTPIRNAVFSAAVGLPHGAVHVFDPADGVHDLMNACRVCEDKIQATCHVNENETLREYVERQGGEGTRR